MDATAKGTEKSEASSYAPFKTYLTGIGENPVIVCNGQNLPDGSLGLLFNKPVFSMRKNLEIRSCELRKTGLEPKHQLNLSGRTDLVVLKPGESVVLRMTTAYAIEVKPPKFNLNSALKESYLQLVGLSVANRRTSPSVLLTDLKLSHYVLYFELPDPIALNYILRIDKCPNLALSIHLCRELSGRECITTNFGTPPTPPPSQLAGSDSFGDIAGAVDASELEEEALVLGACVLTDKDES